MGNIIDPNEAMYKNFEPKLKMRFIMYLDGIPAFLIHAAGRPKLTSSEVELPHINKTRYVKGKSKWEPLDITIYDAITPSGAMLAMEWMRLSHESVTGKDGYADMYQKDITLNVLGPLTDKVEEWVLRRAWPTNFSPDDLDWSDENSALNISLTLRYDDAEMKY